MWVSFHRTYVVLYKYRSSQCAPRAPTPAGAMRTRPRSFVDTHPLFDSLAIRSVGSRQTTMTMVTDLFLSQPGASKLHLRQPSRPAGSKTIEQQYAAREKEDQQWHRWEASQGDQRGAPIAIAEPGGSSRSEYKSSSIE